MPGYLSHSPSWSQEVIGDSCGLAEGGTRENRAGPRSWIFSLLAWFVFFQLWSQVSPLQLLFLFFELIAGLLLLCPGNIDLVA